MEKSTVGLEVSGRSLKARLKARALKLINIQNDDESCLDIGSRMHRN
jgi:hypothetical protein